MSKIMIIPSSKEMILSTLDQVDAYLIGVKDYSINLPTTFDLEEIREISNLLKKENKELFVSVNRNMFNEDIEPLKNILKKLDTYDIKAIFFYDIAIVQLKKKYHLHFDLVWSQEHFTTNYQTINYWYEKGIHYTRLSSEITLKEILEIKKNTKSKCIVPIFGYLPMFASKRKLVTNYKKHFQIDDDSSLYYMEEDHEKYPIIEDHHGTYVYYSKVLNGKKYKQQLEENDIDYLLLNSFLIDSFEEVLDYFLDKKEVNLKEIIKVPIDDSQFMKNTFYKVK